jgi:hypothetical protein
VEKQLVYLLYGGRLSYEREAKFSILSALAASRGQELPVIRVLTDQPQAFEGWPVETRGLGRQTLDDWLGSSGYTHRRKACAIAAACQWADKTIFIDTDTVFRSPPIRLFERFGDGRYLVDTVEMHWMEAKRRNEYAGFVAALERDGVVPDDHLRLCNSGVFGLTCDDQELMQRVVQRIDQWAGHAAGLHTIEQIALSFELQGRQVAEARPDVEHYFAYKGFLHAMQELFFERYGDRFDPLQVELCTELPIGRPQPSRLARFSIKRRLRGLSPELRSIGRKLLYGCALQGSDYQRVCKRVWWGSALADLRLLGGGEGGQWPREIPCPGQREALEFRVFAGDGQSAV